MNNLKKILCVVLALLMVFTVTSFAAEDEKETLSYVILGDSIGWGAGVLNSDEAVYGKIVSDTNGYDYKNDAVNGYMTGDLIRHLNKDNIAKDVAAADIISISIGGNNFLRANMRELIAQYQEGDYSQFDAIVENFYKEFDVIINRIKELNPDAVILMQTLYNPGKGMMKDVYSVALAKLNAAYRRYLEENPGVYELLEVGAAFEGHDEYVAKDNIHPSASGNVTIAKVVLEKLYELGLGENTEPVINHKGIEQTEFFSFEYIKYRIRSFFTKIKNIFTSFRK